MDGVDAGQVREAGPFVQAVQSLVPHAETRGGRDALARRQVADVGRPCRLRPHAQSLPGGGVEQRGGGLPVLGQADRAATGVIAVGRGAGHRASNRRSPTASAAAGTRPPRPESGRVE
ncbi:hypothetical protein [Streptomyces sp. A30]|uniref:hypothetical protein n=1 Tax=Streptomyces sp. A30 TaxID=2789273 RepID=UPI00397ED476